MRSLITATAVLFLSACKGDDPAPTRPAVCDEIVERCHPLDLGSGPIHECHESAESTWDQATCTAKKAECFAACTATVDSGGDAADTGGGGDAADTGGGDTGKADAPTSDAADALPTEASTDGGAETSAGDAADGG